MRDVKQTTWARYTCKLSTCCTVNNFLRNSLPLPWRQPFVMLSINHWTEGVREVQMTSDDGIYAKDVSLTQSRRGKCKITSKNQPSQTTDEKIKWILIQQQCFDIYCPDPHELHFRVHLNKRAPWPERRRDQRCGYKYHRLIFTHLICENWRQEPVQTRLCWPICTKQYLHNYQIEPNIYGSSNYFNLWYIFVFTGLPLDVRSFV